MSISMDDAIARLDLRVPASKKIRCPQHDERVPSLHIYADHYYCFSCGVNGDGVGLLALFTGRAIRDIFDELEDEGGGTFQRTEASRGMAPHQITKRLLDEYHELTRRFWNELRDSLALYAPWWWYDRTVCYWDERFDDLLTLIQDDDLPGLVRRIAIADLEADLDYELV